MTADTIARIADSIQSQMAEILARLEALEKEIIELKKEGN